MHPISYILCEIYKILQDKEGIPFVLTDEHRAKIDSTVKTVNAEYFGVNRFGTLERRAAAYFVFIIKNHAVIDGNKRLAVFWLQIFVDSMKLTLSLPKDITLDELAVGVELTKSNTDFIIDLIEYILFKGHLVEPQ